MKLAAKYRGEVINETIWIEKSVDVYIAKYFCKNEAIGKEMHLMILGDNRMTFENKKQVFDFLAKKHEMDWYQSYNSIRDNSRKKNRVPLAGDLDYIIGERNVLAHCMLDVSKEALELGDGTIRFRRFKNDYQAFDFNEEKLNLIHKILYDIGTFFKNKLDANG